MSHRSFAAYESGGFGDIGESTIEEEMLKRIPLAEVLAHAASSSQMRAAVAVDSSALDEPGSELPTIPAPKGGA